MLTGVHSEIVEEGVLLITIERPSANAIDAATSRALYDAFRRLGEQPELRVGIVRGAGERFFSAGWDVKAGEPHDADHGPGGFAGLTALFDLDKPVIAAVNGAAYGGGGELVLAASLVVAAEHAVFAFPEARMGLLPDAGGLHRLPARVPRAVALEMLLTGRSITAHEALRWGLVNRVVAADRVLAEALDLAREIIRSAPLAVAAIMRATSVAQGATDEDGFARIAARVPQVAVISASEDAAEGVRAFAERRTPAWRGR